MEGSLTPVYKNKRNEGLVRVTKEKRLKMSKIKKIQQPNIKSRKNAL